MVYFSASRAGCSLYFKAQDVRSIEFNGMPKIRYAHYILELLADCTWAIQGTMKSA